MSEPTAWYVLMCLIAGLSGTCLLFGLLSAIGARRAEAREERSANVRAGVRRLLARLHFFNQRNRALVAALLLAYALNLIRAGTPATFRPATWQSLSLIVLIAGITLWAAVREWRMRLAIRRWGEEIDRKAGEGAS